jgi:hypothetical protein
MKQKIFIDGTSNNIQLVVEYNVITNQSSINWINDTTDGHDNFIDSLGIEEDRKVIEQAMEFAKELKQYTEIVNKYNF